MTRPSRTKTFICVTCKKDTFKTAAALSAHQTALDHFLVCPRCGTPFATWREFNSHTSSYVKRQKTMSAEEAVIAAPAPASTPELASTPEPAISAAPSEQIHAGIATQPIPPIPEQDPIVVPIHECDLLYERLLARCHSLSRLGNHGYRLTAAPPKKRLRRSGKGKQADEPKREHHEQEKDEQQTEISQRQKETGAKVDLGFLSTPTSMPWQFPKRKAIALDCEMVGVGPKGNQDALAFLSAVDFFTGEVLINNYVQPTEKIKQWRSRVSGVTPPGLAAAVASGQAIFGWEAARQALWENADANTVLIGHSLDNDLRILRILHFQVVDSAILTGELVFDPAPDARLRRSWALKTLAKALLNRDIQIGSHGHNCLEDTFATRDVVIWCLKYPDEAAAWADGARKEHEIKMEQLRQQQALEHELVLMRFPDYPIE
ncbi:ribonuclease H-like domain-containing protein [Aspergillus pseudodeflectus]|uniref:Ribonuclease H-like domain-containing protein n=1 Tax=Aspergillus pseudodeflectus TaxID=176178 RepID=A0ABR4L3F4_9EURO